MDLWRARGPWLFGAVAGVVATALVGIGVWLPGGRLDVLLEPAGATGPDAFIELESPDLRMGAAEELALGGGVTIRVGIEPGLYGGSGSDHLCDPRLIGDFLAQDPDKASAWASAAGIEVDEIDEFLETLTPVRLLADTWVTNHGYRGGQATPRQSILQAGTMVLVDELGVPRVRCKCGNPLQPPEVPSDLGTVDFIGEPWEGFDSDELLVIEPGEEPVEWFVLVRMEDGRLVARPVGTLGDQDVLIDENGDWIPEIDLELPPLAAVGDGPFALPELSSAGLDLAYEVNGPCRIRDQELVLDSEGLCVVSVSSEAEDPWGALELQFQIDVARLDQEIVLGAIETLVLSEGPIELGAVADSLLPVEYEVSGSCTIDGDQLVPTGVGTCEVVLSQPGDARWAAAEPLEITIEVVDGPPRTPVELTFTLPASFRLDEGPLTLDAGTDPPRPVTFGAAGACAVDGGDSLVARTVGDCAVVAVAVDDDEFQRAIGRDTVTILPRRQTLGLEGIPRSAVLSSAAVPLPATTSAGFDIDYQVSGNCRVTSRGLELTGAGRCEIVASADGDAETEPASETVEITITETAVDRRSQTISFDRPASLVVGGSGVTLSARSSSGLTVTLTLTAGDCRLTGRTLTPGDAGRCTVVASQNGDATYEPAGSVTRSVTVAKLTPTLRVTVTGGPAGEMVEGDTRTVTGAVSGGPGATVTGTSGPCTSSGTGTVTATGTSSGGCVVTVAAPGDANNNPVSATVTIAVKRRQTVTINVSSPSIFVGGRLRPQATASSELAVGLSAGPGGVCSMDGGEVLGVGSGTCTITATQAGNADYAAASASRSIRVASKRTPDVTIEAPSSMAVGDVTTVTASSSEAGVTITIRATGAACEDRGGGALAAVARGTCTVTATHPATPESEAGSAKTTITVSGRADGINFDCIGSCDIQIGKVVGVAIVSQSGLTPSASISGPCTIVSERTSAGYREVQVRGDSAGACTLSASTAGNAQWEPASGSRPINVSSIPTSVTFELGQSLLVGERRNFDIVHNIPRSVVSAKISGSKACSATIDAAGLNGTVEAVAGGTCTVTVTVSGGDYAPASASDSAQVIVLR